MPVKCSTFSNMDSQKRYKLFEKHLLSPNQLEKNDYPREHPHRPGRIYLPYDSLFNNRTDERICARCKQVFANHSNFPHSRVFPCFYHPKKVASGTHQCCGQVKWYPGCTRGMFHVSVECDLTNVCFKKTRPGRSKYACNVFSLDCEMVYTMGGMELAKVGIVGVDGKIVYESFVRPTERILDYNTLYSGVTKEDLISSEAISFDEAQKIVLGLITEDTILIGHSLENDLRSLRLIHEKVVDTSVLFPHERPRYKKSLKSLAAEFLNKVIQTAATGHCCIEDARTAMELVLYKINLDLPPAVSGVSLAPIVQDENDASAANRSFTSERSSAVNFLNSLAYLQQQEQGSNVSRMQCRDFVRNQSDAFGVVVGHNGEWYPISVPYAMNGGLCFYGP